MDVARRGRIIDAADVGDLQAALNLLPPEGGVIHLPPGEYVVDTTLRLALAENQHLCLRGEGRASVIRFTATDQTPLLCLDGVPDSWWPDLKITIRDLTFVVNHLCGDALFLRWPNDTLVDACSFHSFGGTAIVITPNATNVTVRDCWMRDCRRALRADNLHHLTFHGNQTRSSNDSDLRQDEHVYIGRHCREVRIVNNHLAYGHAEGIVLDGTAQHVVANNTIEGFPVGIRAVDCRDITVNSNYIHCPVGLHLQGDNRGLILTANILTDNSTAAVRISHAGSSGGHVIAANVMRQSVYENGQTGIDLGDADECIVAANLFEDLTDPPAAAIRARDPRRHVLAGNRVADTARRAAARLQTSAAPYPARCDEELQALREYFATRPPDCRRVVLTFHQLAGILGRDLPAEALRDSGWWANDADAPQAAAWLGAGWLVAVTKRIEGRIVFARIPESLSPM